MWVFVLLCAFFLGPTQGYSAETSLSGSQALCPMVLRANALRLAGSRTHMYEDSKRRVIEEKSKRAFFDGLSILADQWTQLAIRGEEAKLFVEMTPYQRQEITFAIRGGMIREGSAAKPRNRVVFGVRGEAQGRFVKSTDRKKGGNQEFEVAARDAIGFFHAQIQAQFPQLQAKFPDEFQRLIRRGQTLCRAWQPEVRNREEDFGFDRVDPPAHIEWVDELRTIVFFPSAPFRYSRPSLPPTLLRHGAGSNISNGESHVRNLPGMNRLGMNPLAFHGPYSTPFSPRPKNLQEWLRVVQAQDQWVARHFQNENGLTDDPGLVVVGRSFGALEVEMEQRSASVHERARRVAILSGFSNPFTIPEQVEALRRQPEVQVYEDQIQPILNISKEYQATLAQSVESGAVAQFGAGLIYVISEADEDLGPTAVEDTRAYIQKYAPLARLYVLEDPLKGYLDEREKNNFKPGTLEAMHIQYSPEPNLTRKEAEEFFKAHGRNNIPRELRPRMRNQLHELMMVQMAAMDARADSTRADAESVEAAAFWTERRRQFLLEEGLPPGMTYLDAYIAQQKLEEMREVPNAPKAEGDEYSLDAREDFADLQRRIRKIRAFFNSIPE